MPATSPLELQEAVDRASGVGPAYFYETKKTKPGPLEKIDDTERLLNRDNMLHWLEEHWTQIATPLRTAPGPREVAAVIGHLPVSISSS